MPSKAFRGESWRRPHSAPTRALWNSWAAPGSPFQNLLRVQLCPVSLYKPTSSFWFSGLLLLCQPYPRPAHPVLECRDQVVLNPRISVGACRALRSLRHFPLAQPSSASLGSCAVTHSIPWEAWGSSWTPGCCPDRGLNSAPQVTVPCN